MRNVLLILLSAAALLNAQQQPRRAPGWALPDSKMKIYDLADYRGKIVILEFMQTNCGHCAAAADVLHEVEAQYGSKIQIISVVNSANEKDYTVASYVTGHKVDYPILFDAGQMMFSYTLNPHIDFPHLYVIDGAGNIRFDYTYDVTTRDIFEGKGLSAAIDRVLGNKGGKK
jgi:thiol-disulfide isomerase/thioredoxin